MDKASKRRMLFVGGEGQAHPIMEEGKCFVEIPDRRFSWEDWDGAIDPSNSRECEQLRGWDVARIEQLVDKANRPDGKYICVVWTADGKQQRIVQTLIVEELSPQERVAHRATLAKEGEPTVKPKSKRNQRQKKDGVMWTPNQKRSIVAHMVELAAKRTSRLEGRGICEATLIWIPKQDEYQGVMIPGFSTLQGWLKEKGIRTR